MAEGTGCGPVRETSSGFESRRVTHFVHSCLYVAEGAAGESPAFVLTVRALVARWSPKPLEVVRFHPRSPNLGSLTTEQCRNSDGLVVHSEFVDVRAWYSDCAVAFQAAETGLIPVARSISLLPRDEDSALRTRTDRFDSCKEHQIQRRSVEVGYFF